MKILQVSTSFKPAWETGGTCRVAYEISKNLVKRGHRVTVFTTDRGEKRINVQKNQPVLIDGIRVYYFRNISNYLAKKKTVIPYYLPAIAKRQVKDFDIIHMHEHRSLLTAIVYHYARKYGVPYVLQSHGSLPRMGKQGLKKLYDWVWGYRILRDATKVIALTETETEQCRIMGVDEDKIEIIPNGIDLSEYENLPEKGEFRKKYGIQDNEKIILYLGRIHKTKGIDLLISAYADLIKKLDNVRLVIVGPDDGFLPFLKKQVKDLKINHKVLFTGPLYGKEKLEAYVDADVFVLPSIYETFPNTVLEACACGTPVIATKAKHKHDWIHNKVGYVVERDKHHLQNAIVKILKDEQLRKNLGKEGKRLIKQRFNWEKIVEKFEDIYSSVSNRSSKYLEKNLI